MATKPHLIVCERTQRWATAWRRALGEGVTVGEVRSLTQVDERLAGLALPIAVDASAFSAERLLTGVARWSQAGSPVIVLGATGQLAEEFAYREAGAVHVIASPRQIGWAVAIVTRYRPAVPAPKPAELPLEQAAFERLPWGRFRKAGQPPAGQHS